MDVMILLRVCGIVVFGAAAIGKSIKLRRFTATLMMLGIPRRGSRIASAGVILLESATALALLSGHLPLAGFTMMLCAAAFATSAIIAVKRGLHVPCACFGIASHPLGLRNVGAAAMLFVASLLLLASHRSPPLHELVQGAALGGYAALAAVTLLAARWALAAGAVTQLVHDRRAAAFRVDASTLRLLEGK